MVPAEIYALLPEIVLVTVGIVVALVGAGGAHRRVLAALSAAALAVAGILSIATVAKLPGAEWLPDLIRGLHTDGRYVYGLLEVNAFAVLFKLVFLGVALLVVLAGPGTYTGRHQGEYYGLLLLATTGMLVVAGSRELFTLFIGLELASFSTYALAAFHKRDPASSEAAMKYFIVGSLSSALTLFGISLLYGQQGATTFADLAAYGTRLAVTGMTPLSVFTWAFLLAGFAFKIAAVPFHMWAPDVYEGAPTSISAFLAAGSKNTGFIALFKIFLVGLLAIKGSWDYAIAIVAIVTMTVGNVLALVQDNLKRMLAYSSVAHAGYILIALPVAGVASVSDYAVAGGLFHVITHAIMKSGAFLALAALAVVGVAETMDGIRGLARRAPIVALSIAIIMLSFAGIPPLAGFASKFVLFSAAVFASQSGPGWLIWLAIAGIVNSAISLYYYARVIRMMYVEETPGYVTAPPPKLRVPTLAAVSVVLAALLTIVLGILWQPMLDWSLVAAAAMGP